MNLLLLALKMEKEGHETRNVVPSREAETNEKMDPLLEPSGSNTAC